MLNCQAVIAFANVFDLFKQVFEWGIVHVFLFFSYLLPFFGLFFPA